jgi:hypothetical protein
MIGYVTIGTNDLGRAVSFYDKVLSDLQRLHGYFGAASGIIPV